MRKYWIYAFQIVSLLLLVFLAISTFIPQQSEFLPGEYPGAANGLIRFLHLDRFYNSPINAILWGLLSLVILISVFTNVIRKPVQKVIHILLALIFIIIAIEKSSNQRFDIAIEEGETIHFASYTENSSDKYDVTIQLLKFEIQMHPGGRMPKAFISHLLINEKDTILLAVNKPVGIGHYRLYQSAYDQVMTFYLNINNELFPVAFGDTVSVNGNEYIFEAFNHEERVFDLKVNDRYFHSGMQQPVSIGDVTVTIMPGGLRYTSIIEVAEVRWTKLLLMLAILYIGGLAWAFWHRKK
ncbi:MAG: cytochrome c biogenesis protein ResB [Candidatus Marinimicrobia bacterium]|nr:cytochrome c biogenesis protein ResB [Candidatus Neomarinimicrobiota bacterium]